MGNIYILYIMDAQLTTSTPSQRSVSQIQELKRNSAYVQNHLIKKNVYAEILEKYTCGDAKLYSIFRFCRRPSQSTLRVLMQMHSQSLDAARDVVRGINDLILRAPRLSTEIVVYRGKPTKPLRNADGNIVDMGMASTSVRRNVAVGFTHENGFLLKIIIPPHCPLLLLRDISAYKPDAIDEFEVVLPFGATFLEHAPPTQIEKNITQYNVTYLCDADSSTALSDATVEHFRHVMSDMDIIKANAKKKFAEDQAQRAAEKSARYRKGGRAKTRKCTRTHHTKCVSARTCRRRKRRR